MSILVILSQLHLHGKQQATTSQNYNERCWLRNCFSLHTPSEIDHTYFPTHTHALDYFKRLRGVAAVC
jgi:hypothetical protein